MAKDKGTGKEQKIVIKSDSKLSEEEIENMVKEGEKFKEQDRKVKEKMEAKNQLDSMVYQAEKTLKEQDKKLPPELKSEVEEALKVAKSKQNSDDVEVLKKAKADFEAKLHKLSEHVYKTAAQQQQSSSQQQSQGGNKSESSSKNSTSSNDDDVVDAEVEEDKDNKK